MPSLLHVHPVPGGRVPKLKRESPSSTSASAYAVSMAPHLPGGISSTVCTCQGLAGGETAGIDQKGAKELFLGFRMFIPNSREGLKHLCPQAASPGMYSRWIAQVLSLLVTLAKFPPSRTRPRLPLISVQGLACTFRGELEFRLTPRGPGKMENASSLSEAGRQGAGAGSGSGGQRAIPH